MDSLKFVVSMIKIEGAWIEGMIEFWEVNLNFKSFRIDFKISPQTPTHQVHISGGFWWLKNKVFEGIKEGENEIVH